MASEKILSAVYGRILERYPNRTIAPKSALVAVRTVLTPAENRRLLFIAKAAEESTEAEKILNSFGDEILDRMNPGFLFVVMPHMLRPIRRPGILEGYSYLGRIFIALSERLLVTGEDNALVVSELISFTHLPRPIKNANFEKTCRTWNCEIDLVKEFMDSNFMRKAHKEQVDVFQETDFNFLHYNAASTFLYAMPRAPEISNIVVRKNRIND